MVIAVLETLEEVEEVFLVHFFMTVAQRLKFLVVVVQGL
jgi:hypothetical protein